jgi:phosphoglycerate dehydrogenase-like enzyme/glyoxylase-like metal-dependent hydrolase (beta-lactamase superfamily II)
MKCRAQVWLLTLAGLLSLATADAADLPKMKFNEVKEVAPGVFFRFSSISATDKSVVFGGSNNIWVVFDDYVVVIDANFPKEAGDVIQAVKKTTNKPIRYVFDTHHHGDHAYGNAVFAKEGASVVAQTNCARLLRVNGPKEFADAGKAPAGREDIRKSSLKVPDLVFDDKLVLDDGKQRVEFLFFGHAHTSGDGCAYLPKHKILCTGDACVNGAYNFMGHSDSASWIRALERMQQLDISMVCPGHGPIAGNDLLEKQKRYFIELRQHVQKGIAADKSLDDIIKTIDLPWYKEWTGVTPAGDNIRHVYAELTGRIMPADLAEDFGIYEGPSPTKADPGWKKPRRIVVPNLMPARLAELKRVAPEIEFIPVPTAEDAAKAAGDADAVLGFCTADIAKAGRNLRWIQVGHAGVEKDLSPEVVNSKVVLTNLQRLHGPNVAEQALALLLCLTRGIREALPAEVQDGRWIKKFQAAPQELHGKTMLVVGLGGIGTQISRRAHAFGMRVMAIDPKDQERPDFVFSLDRPAKMMDRLPQADVVVIACPLTAETRGMFGAAQFKVMKPSAYLINIARGGIVQTPALLAALKNKQLAGAGLDVIDPEPLPAEHPLWKVPNVIISPHIGGQSPDVRERQWRLWRENLRRFVAGEPLLCVVDKTKGY